MVLLQLGAKMPTEPVEHREVRPYCVTAGSYTMSDQITVVPMLDARRTFWEKVTMLHEHNNRRSPQAREAISRQFADVAVLWRGAIGQAALDDLGLLRTVAEEKDLFFHDGHADYGAAATGKLHLVPPSDHQAHLRSDYRKNAPIYFGTPPNFDEILEALEEIEQEVRRRV